MFIFLYPPPEPPWPFWATDSCIEQIENIVQHESGSMQSSIVFDFIAQQIIYDIAKYGCNSLTKWRWKIGKFDNRKVTHLVQFTVLTTIEGFYWKRYPPCKFIGQPADIPVWESYGYKIRIDYTFKVKSFTVIGTNCK